MASNEHGIPLGPNETEPGGPFKSTEEREAALRSALEAAGLRLGAYDERIVEWFARFSDMGTFAVMASWVVRATKSEETIAAASERTISHYLDQVDDLDEVDSADLAENIAREIKREGES